MDSNIELYNYLKKFITPERLNRFQKIITQRTSYICTVLEDIYQPHNASAVLRSCDCFGIQDVHIIENKNKYNINPDVALGSSKWLNLYYYNQKEHNTLETISYLKEKNYRIIATTPYTDNTLEDLDLSKAKLALVFGTEMTGVSDVVVQNADQLVKVPMYGFSESFNISVSAAIVFYSLMKKLRKSNIKWQLPEEEQIATLIRWIQQTVKNPDGLIKKFYEKKGN